MLISFKCKILMLISKLIYTFKSIVNGTYSTLYLHPTAQGDPIIWETHSKYKDKHTVLVVGDKTGKFTNHDHNPKSFDKVIGREKGFDVKKGFVIVNLVYFSNDSSYFIRVDKIKKVITTQSKIGRDTEYRLKVSNIAKNSLRDSSKPVIKPKYNNLICSAFNKILT